MLFLYIDNIILPTGRGITMAKRLQLDFAKAGVIARTKAMSALGVQAPQAESPSFSSLFVSASSGQALELPQTEQVIYSHLLSIVKTFGFEDDAQLVLALRGALRSSPIASTLAHNMSGAAEVAEHAFANIFSRFPNLSPEEQINFREYIYCVSCEHSPKTARESILNFGSLSSSVETQIAEAAAIIVDLASTTDLVLQRKFRKLGYRDTTSVSDLGQHPQIPTLKA